MQPVVDSLVSGGGEDRRAIADFERRFFPSVTSFVIAHYADDVEYR